MARSFDRFILLLGLLAFAGCAPEGRTAFGLPALDLRLDEEYIADLIHGGTEGREVPVEFTFGREWGSGTIAISGQGSIASPKHGYDLAIGKDRTLKLSPQVQDLSLLRTMLGKRLYDALSIDAPEVEPVTLFINGRYRGLYMKIERIDASYFSRRGGDAHSIVSSRVIRGDLGPGFPVDPSGAFRAIHGTLPAPELRALGRWANEPPSADLKSLARGAADLLQMARFLAASTYLANCDGFSANLYIHQDEGDRRLRFTPWDWERIYDRACDFGVGTLVERSPLATGVIRDPDTRAAFLETLEEAAARFPLEEIEVALSEDAARISEAHAADPYLGQARVKLESERARLQAKAAEALSQVAGLVAQIPDTGPDS